MVILMTMLHAWFKAWSTERLRRRVCGASGWPCGSWGLCGDWRASLTAVQVRRARGMSWPVGRDSTPRERLLLGIDGNCL